MDTRTLGTRQERDFQELFSGPLQLLGKADISGSVLQQLGQ